MRKNDDDYMIPGTRRDMGERKGVTEREKGTCEWKTNCI